MNIKPFILVGIISLATNILGVAQGTFEGVIVTVTENNQREERSTLTWHIKGNNHRIDFKQTVKGESGEYTMLIENNQPSLITEIDGKKQKMAVGQHFQKNSSDIPESYTLIRKEEDMVYGEFKCTRYTIEYSKGIIELWLAIDYRLNPDNFPTLGTTNNFLKIAGELEKGSYPVKVVAKHPNGILNFSQEVTSVDAKELTDDIFDVK